MANNYARKAAVSFPYVQSVTDRTGKVRHYFRKGGADRVALPGGPGSKEFIEAYRSVLPVKLRPRKKDGQIYFFKMGDFVKIGFSASWEERLKTIATSAPLPVEVLLLIPGSLQVERTLHLRFLAHRTQREWFRATPEIFEFVEMEKRKAANKSFYNEGQKS